MDTRRLLTVAAAGLGLCGCASSPSLAPDIVETAALRPSESPVLSESAPAPEREAAASTEPAVGRPYAVVVEPAAPTRPATGRAAIVAANRAASAPSRSDAFVGGVQVFSWAPGRVYEVWTAPLRVTTLTLGAGETIVSKAAGDTIRWQIGDTTSGVGASQRTHLLLKPLERGLETNLVLTTNRRVYLIDLKSGSADGFNAAVSWDEPPLTSGGTPTDEVSEQEIRTDIVLPQGQVDARYRIRPEGRRPRWTPTSAFNDGRRTFITFDADLQIDEAPALFLINAQGEAQLVNYRQQGGLVVVDRVFDQAELRLGDRRPQVVRIQRLSGGRR